MAICLRPAFSYRSILLLHCRHLSHTIHSPNLTDTASLNPSDTASLNPSDTASLNPSSTQDFLRESRRIFANGRKSKPSTLSIRDFLRESRRSFAKGRKSKDRGAWNAVEVVAGVGPTIKQNATLQMDAAVVALSRELSKLQTGRASAGMLDHIIVETGGVKMPLSRIAVVSVLDPKTLSVAPYDPDSLKHLENAIVSSPLGLNPKTDGQRLIAVIPPLTKEHIQPMCKVVSKSCEDVKQNIRRARLKALHVIKKARPSILKGVYKLLKKEVDEQTKKFIKSAELMCKAKEKEIAEG